MGTVWGHLGAVLIPLGRFGRHFGVILSGSDVENSGGQPPQTMMLPNFAPQLLAMAYNRQGVTSLLNYLNQEDTVQVGPTV